MGIQTHRLVINGVDQSTHLQPGWTIEMTFGQNGTTFNCHLRDVPAPGGPPSFSPRPLQTIILTDLGTGVNLFSGLITEPEMIELTVGVWTWAVTARDFTIYADKTVVFGDYVLKTADYIIHQLISQCPGNMTQPGGAGKPVTGGALTSNNVQAGPLLARVVVNFESLTAALNKITKMCAISAFWGWYIDNSRDLHWYNQLQISVSTPYYSDDGTDVGANVNRYERNISYKWDGKDIRNRISVRGGNNSLNTQWTDYATANGTTTGWPLTYPVHSAKPDTTLSVTIDGVSKTVAKDTGSPPTTQYVFTKAVPGGSPIKGVWWLRVGTDSTPVNGAAIVASYPYLLPVITQVDDSASQAANSTLDNNGIFWMGINDSGIADIYTAKSRGQRDLQLYKNAVETVKFRTIPGAFTGHIKAGELINFRSKKVPDAGQNWIVGQLSANYLVRSSRITGGPYRTYEIEAIRVG